LREVSVRVNLTRSARNVNAGGKSLLAY
jgi:hypothetical protein